MTSEMAWIAGIGALLGLLLTWLSLHLRGKERLLDDLPTSKVSGVFIGLSELKGTAECARPLRGPLSEQEVVHYSFTVEEHWSRTVHETYTDKNGRSRSRTRRESGWTTLAHGSDSTPFFVRDDTGCILVRPEGAKIDPVGLFLQECGREDPLYYAKGPMQSVAHSDHRRRFREEGLPLGTELYVVGQARERKDVVAPEIAASDQAEIFLISSKNETQVRRGYGLGSWLSLAGAVAAAATAGWLVGARWLGYETGMPYPVRGALAGGGGVLLLWAVCWVWMVFNSIIGLRNRVRQGWAQIEVELKRRHDLIPRLNSVLSAQQGHERSLQESLAALRAQASATAPGVAGPDFEGLAPTLRAVVEAYPELGAVAGFRELHDELVRTEQRIALAREYYNTIATHFATRLERIPEGWVAGLGGMKPEPLLTASGFERAEVRVDFQS